jgi:hypothetical protein
MVVIKEKDLDKISEIAESMNCYFNYRGFTWEGYDMCEVLSPCKPFLAIVKKEFMETDKEAKYFIGL